MNKSKNIVVTGASTGIGYAVSKAFINKGYMVFGSVRKQDDADRLRRELGDKYHPMIFDVTDHEAVDRASRELEEKLADDGIGGLVNNAGVAVSGPALHIPIDEYREQFEINVFGLIKTTQAFAPLLGARENHKTKPGRILQVSSVAGKLGWPFLAPYTASKHAVEGFSECLRIELLLYGIDVILIEPGAVKTPIWKKNGTPEIISKYNNTPFATMADKFRKNFVEESIKTSLSSETIGKNVVNIFEKKNPNVRYPMVSRKLKNWTIPRLLPSRTVDRFIGKKIGLLK